MRGQASRLARAAAQDGRTRRPHAGQCCHAPRRRARPARPRSLAPPRRRVLPCRLRQRGQQRRRLTSRRRGQHHDRLGSGRLASHPGSRHRLTSRRGSVSRVPSPRRSSRLLSSRPATASRVTSSRVTSSRASSRPRSSRIPGPGAPGRPLPRGLRLRSALVAQTAICRAVARGVAAARPTASCPGSSTSRARPPGRPMPPTLGLASPAFLLSGPPGHAGCEVCARAPSIAPKECRSAPITASRPPTQPQVAPASRLRCLATATRCQVTQKRDGEAGLRSGWPADAARPIRPTPASYRSDAGGVARRAHLARSRPVPASPAGRAIAPRSRPARSRGLTRPARTAARLQGLTRGRRPRSLPVRSSVPGAQARGPACHSKLARRAGRRSRAVSRQGRRPVLTRGWAAGLTRVPPAGRQPGLPTAVSPAARHLRQARSRSRPVSSDARAASRPLAGRPAECPSRPTRQRATASGRPWLRGPRRRAAAGAPAGLPGSSPTWGQRLASSQRCRGKQASRARPDRRRRP